jgi:hypothetical protein
MDLGMASPQDDFWGRMRLQETDRVACLDAVQGRYNGYDVKEFGYQGYCSYTLLLIPRQGLLTGRNEVQSNGYALSFGVAGQLIVQLRPAQHALDLDIVWAASRTYSPLVPTIQALDIHLSGGLCAYEMNRVEGTPMSCLQHCQVAVDPETWKKQETLIASFARLISQGWPTITTMKRRDSILRPDSPLANQLVILSQCRGKVGSCIVQKLERLTEELPDQWLRERARAMLNNLRMINDYSVVLNHGDLIPSNILVDEQTWEIRGLVDWAEAEYLPFGTSLYGLEHLLGFFQPESLQSGRPRFVYYDNARQLREFFWTHLLDLVPELRIKQEEVRVMRDVGVLLWHGFAWDEGAIDRVVDEVNDGEELVKLRAFLSAS